MWTGSLFSTEDQGRRVGRCAELASCGSLTPSATSEKLRRPLFEICACVRARVRACVRVPRCQFQSYSNRKVQHSYIPTELQQHQFEIHVGPAVLKGTKERGFVTPTEMNIRGDALCWARHGQDMGKTQNHRKQY